MKKLLNFMVVFSLASVSLVSVAKAEPELEKASKIHMKLMGNTMNYFVNDMASGKKPVGCYEESGGIVSLGDIHTYEGIDFKCVSMKGQYTFFPVVIAMKCKSNPEYEGCSNPESKAILSQF